MVKKLLYLSISILCLALAMLIGSYLGGQSARAHAPRNGVIAAQAFVLVRDDGTICGRWETKSDGSTVLNFFDQNGEMRIMLGIDNRGTVIHEAPSEPEMKLLKE